MGINSTIREINNTRDSNEFQDHDIDVSKRKSECDQIIEHA